MELKSLYFNLVYVFLFSAKTRVYKQSTRTYTQSGAESSLFQFCLTITEPFFSNLSRGNVKTVKVSAFHAPLVNYASSQTHRCIQISSCKTDLYATVGLRTRNRIINRRTVRETLRL